MWDSMRFMTAHAPRASRALVNPTDKVPLHWNMTVAPPMNTPTSQKNTASKTND